MQNVRKFRKLLVFLSFLFIVMISLLCSDTALAVKVNPAGTTINDTLEGDRVDPNCINYGMIETYPDGKFGMHLPDRGFASNFGRVITHGQRAHGIYAAMPYSTVTNEGGGSITTYGYDAYGIYVPNLYSTATNKSGGSITTEGHLDCGIRADNNSTATNSGIIDTKGQFACGMYTTFNSTATNKRGGIITTYGKYAHGIFAYNHSTVTNETVGSITTHGEEAHGIYAVKGSTATNEGNITTRGQIAHGMLTLINSTATNRGNITTEGTNACGMWVEDNSTATNENGGNIITYGAGASGMTVSTSSTATNKIGGSITTHGESALGMYIFISTANNNGRITTYGRYAAGMGVDHSSTATNSGSITTGGTNAYGMLVAGNSTATNETGGSITTHGEEAHGIYAINGSTATNKIGGSITTYGEGAHGMFAQYDSTATNEGGDSITTHGILAYGMYASGLNSTVTNSGSITTRGEDAHGMSVDNGSTATNSGTITVKGANAHAVFINNSAFTNSGTLDSLHGNAVTAKDNSSVILKDETKLANSHILEGDDTSSLEVNMSQDLSAVVKDFGTFTHSGTGAVIFEDGSSLSKFENKSGKTIKVAPNATFETSSYTQETGASLHVYVPSDPNAGYPLKVSNEAGGAAKFAGNLTIDYTGYPLPGKYTYIYVAGEREGSFNSISYIDPKGFYTIYEPKWVSGSSWYYTSLVDYAFSEQALGLVSAIEDWSLLRWIMANHLQDVASEIDNLEAGKKVYYAHFLANKTDRDPAGRSPLGYESDTKGLSFGFDKKTDEKTVWGIYAGYTEKDIDFTDVVPASSDWEEQDSWHIGAYICKRYDKWIISDTLTYRTTDHDSFRRQKDGDARASFDSWAITNDIRAGYVVKEIGENSNWEIVPEIGINVGHFDRGGYTETNGYTYGDYDTTVTEGVIGVRFKGEFISKDGSRFSPYLRLSYVNVLSGDDVTIDETRYGTKRWFTEELDDDYFVADLGMTLYSADNFNVSLSYNGRFGDDTDSHGGWLRLEWKQ